MPRLIDNVLSKRLEQTGAVEVTGTMWCGKTWSSMAYARFDKETGIYVIPITALGA